jgi:hypothetical protein
MVTLDGHVVAEVQLSKTPNVWWVLDADYGVVVEHDIKTIESEPDLIKLPYLQAGYDEKIVNKLVDIYGPQGNYEITDRSYCRVEGKFYQLKWIAPLALMMPWVLFWLLASGMNRIRGNKQRAVNVA